MSNTDTIQKTKSGAIVYDTDIINQISDAAFDAASWARAEPVEGALRSGGVGPFSLEELIATSKVTFAIQESIRSGAPVVISET